MTADDHVMHPRPPSDEEERAWRVAGRLRAVREIVRDVLIYATLGAVLFTSWQVHQSQQNGSPTSQRLISILNGIAAQQDDIDSASSNSSAVLHQLQDCLQPTGKCYQQSQRRTSNVVSLILVAVSCSQGYTDLSDAQRIEATQTCVADWLSRHPKLSSP